MAYAAKYRNRTDQRSGRKQWFVVASGLNFVISVQGNDWVRFLYLAACRGTRGKRSIGYFAALNNICVPESVLRVF